HPISFAHHRPIHRRSKLETFELPFHAKSRYRFDMDAVVDRGTREARMQFFDESGASLLGTRGFGH
ncbi:MAG: hypothetical protein VX500_03930, partial [Planctomycetota bacterium]|nr:hypothetical protein [Planctomycetota bacterium]